MTMVSWYRNQFLIFLSANTTHTSRAAHKRVRWVQRKTQSKCKFFTLRSFPLGASAIRTFHDCGKQLKAIKVAHKSADTRRLRRRHSRRWPSLKLFFHAKAVLICSENLHWENISLVMRGVWTRCLLCLSSYALRFTWGTARLLKSSLGNLLGCWRNDSYLGAKIRRRIGTTTDDCSKKHEWLCNYRCYECIADSAWSSRHQSKARLKS